MRNYLVLAAGLLVLGGVLAALLLLPAPRVAPVLTPTPAVDASGNPVTSASPSAAPDAETGSEIDEEHSPVDPPSTPAPSVAPSPTPSVDLVACDVIDAAAMAELTGLRVAEAVTPEAAADPDSEGEPQPLLCEYRDAQGRAVVMLAAADPVDDAAADAAERSEQLAPAGSGMTAQTFTNESGETIGVMFGCPDCGNADSRSGLIYDDAATWQLSLTEAGSLDASEAFAAIAAELTD